MVIRWGYTIAYTLLAVVLSLSIWIYWIRTHSLQFRFLPQFLGSAIQSSITPSSGPLMPGPLRFFHSDPTRKSRYDLWRAPYAGRWRLAEQEDLSNGRAQKYTVELTPSEMHGILLTTVYHGTVLNAFLWPTILATGNFVLLLALGLFFDVRRRVRLLSYGGIQTRGRREVAPERFTRRSRPGDFVIMTQQPAREEE